MTTEAPALYRLMTWLSPAYPVGAYSYSHGIEYAVEAGLVRDRDGLTAWVAQATRHGAGLSDAALLAAAWRAVGCHSPSPPHWGGEGRGEVGNALESPTSPSLSAPGGGEGQEAEKSPHPHALGQIVELANAWRGSAELALESRAQGAAFLATTRAAWPHPALDELALRWRGEVMMPVAVGVAARVHGIALDAVLAAYLHSFVGNLVSAGMRLIPLGQTEGQQAIAALEPVVAATRRAAQETPLDEIGTASPAIDWSSMRHESQYTRLFRS